MPIKAENKKRYPNNWKSIRRKILKRSEVHGKECCECRGICGLNHYTGRCKAPNGIAIRWHEKLIHWVRADKVIDSFRWKVKEPKIVLTIAHLDHIPEHNKSSNLRALCQRCHLNLDKDQHMKNSAETRRRKKDREIAHQGTLFDL